LLQKPPHQCPGGSMYCASQGMLFSSSCGIEMQIDIHFKVQEVVCYAILQVCAGVVANRDRHEGYTTRHPVFRVRTWRSPDRLHRAPANNCSRPLSERGGAFLQTRQILSSAGISWVDQPTGAGGDSDLWYLHMSRTSG
jgi:hypothetical protein